MEEMTQVLTWKTHNDGKNHGSPQAAEYTMRETITTMEAQGQRPLAPPLFATRGGYNGGNYLFLSLSLSHALPLLTRYTTNFTNVSTTTKVLCPKSYLYIYDFRVIYMCVPTNRSDGSELDPVLPIFPSGGT